MAVAKSLVVLVLVAACSDPGSRKSDASIPDGLVSDTPPYVMPDAAPPPYDAGAPPAVACQSELDAAMQCELPPSECLGTTRYLIYYTGGSCVDNQCEFETHWLYCYAGCVPMFDPTSGAGCSPGFT